MNLIEIPKPYNTSFYAGDSEELFFKNLRRMPSTWEWRDREVKYSLNSQGYRAPEWNQIEWSNSTLIFGCSFVFGVGINDDDTCSRYLEKINNMPVVNLGVSGSSPMLQWINSSILRHNNIEPRAVVYIWPPANRVTELQGNQQARHHLPSSKNEWGWSWITNEVHNTEYLRYTIWSTTKLWTCPVLHYHIDHNLCNSIAELKNLELGPNDRARDINNGIAHPGPLTNKFWAEKISLDLNGLW